VKYVKDILSDVKRGKYDDLLVLSKSISKKLDEYKVNAQHVKALRDALSEGYVSEDFKQYGIIHYVICKGNKPKMVGATGGEEIDYDYYIRNQLKPIVSRLGIQLERNASIDTFF
jgi:DNA polymerase elongation subunit (family B)